MGAIGNGSVVHIDQPQQTTSVPVDRRSSELKQQVDELEDYREDKAKMHTDGDTPVIRP